MSSLSFSSFPIVAHVQTLVETANDGLEDFSPCIVVVVVVVVVVAR